MISRSEPPGSVPPGFLLGSKIDISSWYGPSIIVDLSGTIHCYVGYLGENRPLDLPYYSPCVALHHKSGRSSFGFVELRRGTLRGTSFLQDDLHYRLLDDRWLVLPQGADASFGVFERSSHEEDVERTRELFGGTRRDIESVATVLSTIMGREHHELQRLPRVTFSKTRNNSCDISGCLIPKNFPYLAFENSQYDWSHISLHGFYRLLAFLCASRRNNPVRQSLLDSGITADVLNILLKGAEGYGLPLPYPDGVA